jgi:hypothetical protein
MSFASNLLPLLDRARSIGAQLGLRQSDVLVRVIQWSGDVPGEGTKTVTDTPLLVNGRRPKVAQVSNRDAMLSAGAYTNQDMRIGPLTPPFPGGGVAYGTLDPPVTLGTEVHFRITGPGVPAGGLWYKRVGSEADSALHVYLIVRTTGIAEP